MLPGLDTKNYLLIQTVATWSSDQSRHEEKEAHEMFGKISAQLHTTLCIQFLDREKNDKNNTLPLGKQICLTIVWGCAEILPNVQTFNNLNGLLSM